MVKSSLDGKANGRDLGGENLGGKTSDLDAQFVLGVEREVVVGEHAAVGTEGHAQGVRVTFGGSVGAGVEALIFHVDGFRVEIADCGEAASARQRKVAVDEGGRHGEHVGLIVEAVA